MMPVPLKSVSNFKLHLHVTRNYGYIYFVFSLFSIEGQLCTFALVLSLFG